MKDELFKFSSYLERLFMWFYSLFPKKSKFRNSLNDTEQLFKKDLIEQFKNIKKDGKYSSRIFGKTQGIFLERMKYKYSFNGGFYFKIEKRLNKKFFTEKIFYAKKNFYTKKKII